MLGPAPDGTIIPRIRIAKLLIVAGLLTMALALFAAPVTVLVVMFGTAALAQLDVTTMMVLVLISVIPAIVIGAFLATLLLHAALSVWMMRCGGLIRIDPHKQRIADIFGRSWSRASHAPGILVRGRGGHPYSLVLSDIDGVPSCSLAQRIEDAFAALWSAARPARCHRIVVPLFLLTDVDAILATQAP